MRRSIVGGFCALMALDTLSQIGFKLSALHTGGARFDLGWMQSALWQPWALAIVIGYLGAFFVYMTLIKHAPVGPAFATSHLEIVSVILFSLVYLHERLSLWQGLGCACIVCGVLILAATERLE